MTRVDHFLADPLPRLPERRPGSIRRTSHLDMINHEDGSLELRGVAVDPSGSASCRALVDARRELISLDLEPNVAGNDALVGRVVGRGFRSAVNQLCRPGTLQSVLLSELPVGALLSGYGSLYSGLLPTPLSDAFMDRLPVDVCAGWAVSGSLMVHVRKEREVLTPQGPIPPADSSDDSTGDGSGWHDMPALAAGSLRRQRLIERAGTDVWAMFRDSYAQPHGVITVLHEYTVAATLTGDEAAAAAEGMRIASCRATPRVLPWAECPQAALSAERLVGRRLGDLRALVRDDLVGISTCTHLNDLLASLAQAEELVESPDQGRAR
jgi:hypothetical protein